MLLNANQFDFSPERREYVQDLSTLLGQGLARPRAGPCSVRPVTQMHRELTLRDCPDLGQHRGFTLTRIDKSGGDIAGWRFQECQGPNCDDDNPLRVLLIND